MKDRIVQRFLRDAERSFFFLLCNSLYDFEIYEIALTFLTKPQKKKNILKKCLTKEGRGDIISRLSA
jgi:hypothetical protein